MAADRRTMIEITNVSKSYRRDSLEIPVLHSVSLVVPEGEFLALMGPSGSGKTTLLNLIAGIDRPTSGNVIVNGVDIGMMNESTLARWRSSNVGFIFLLTSLKKKGRREHVEAALRLVGLGDRMSHYPKQLSGGQEQRVAIARAIVTDPTIIVADEPTGDLDRVSAGEIMALLEQLNAEYKKTIVMVTHDPRAAEKAHTVMHLEKGELSA